MRRVRRKIISGGENSAGDCGKGALLGLRPYNTKEVACKRCICFSLFFFFFHLASANTVKVESTTGTLSSKCPRKGMS